MTLRETINRLEKLSKNGLNDNLPVVINDGKSCFYPEITSAYINQESDYNFDEANCGPDQWVELGY